MKDPSILGTYYIPPFKLSEVTVLPNFKILSNTGCQLSASKYYSFTIIFFPPLACYPLGRMYFPDQMTLGWPNN